MQQYNTESGTYCHSLKISLPVPSRITIKSQRLKQKSNRFIHLVNIFTVNCVTIRNGFYDGFSSCSGRYGSRRFIQIRDARDEVLGIIGDQAANYILSPSLAYNIVWAKVRLIFEGKTWLIFRYANP
jgi:hypothetical protein